MPSLNVLGGTGNTDFITLDGDAALRRAFDSLTSDQAKKNIRNAMRAAMKAHVLPAAKANALSMFGHRTVVPVVRKENTKRKRSVSVHLADTIKVRAVKSKKRSVLGIAVSAGTRKELGLSDEDGYYPFALEYGWVMRRKKGGPVVKTIPARPFMRPALWNNREKVLRDFGRMVDYGIREIWAKAGFGGLPPTFDRKAGRPQA